MAPTGAATTSGPFMGSNAATMGRVPPMASATMARVAIAQGRATTANGIPSVPEAILRTVLRAAPASAPSRAAVAADLAASSAPRADASFNGGSHLPFAADGFLPFARACTRKCAR